MELADKTLNCSDCGSSFTFTAGEQEFFASRGFTNEPKRCASCRSTRRSQRGDGGGGGGGSFQRERYEAICAECGTQTTVPFQPRGIRPVYCQDCFSRQRSSGF
ncbi:MAG: zinc-ribbon domain containing protein [Chloroflexi bacterium]|nr:zinc-ribbon domain containing protein [Chloroflexota bacterium]